MSKLNQGDK